MSRGSFSRFIFFLSYVFSVSVAAAADTNPCDQYLSAIQDLARGHIQIEAAKAEGQIPPAAQSLLKKEIAKKRAQLSEVLGEEQLQAQLALAIKKQSATTQQEVVENTSRRQSKLEDESLLNNWEILYSLEQADLKKPLVTPDSRFLLSIQSNKIQVSNLQTGQNERVFAEQKFNILDFSISPDGKFVALSSSDDKFKIYDFATGQLIFQKKLILIDDLVFSPDSRQLVATSLWVSRAVLVDIYKSKSHTLKYSGYRPNNAAFTPDSKKLVLSFNRTQRSRFFQKYNKDMSAITVWDVSAKKIIGISKTDSHIVQLEVAAKGRSVHFTLNQRGAYEYDISQTQLKTWRNWFEKPIQLKPADGYGYSNVKRFYLSPKNNYKIEFVSDFFKIIDVSAQKVISQVETMTGEHSLKVAFAEDRDYVVLVSNFSPLRVVSLKSGDTLQVLGSKTGLLDIRMSPDEKYLIVTYENYKGENVATEVWGRALTIEN